MDKPKIAVICVSYNTDREAVRFVLRISEMEGAENIDVYLVDNSSKTPKDIFLKLEKESRRVFYIPAPNPGYFGAARMVQEKYSGLFSGYEWVVICNVDMDLPDTGVFRRLTDSKYDSNCGVVAPVIFSTLSQKDTNPLIRQRPTAKKMLFYKRIFSNLVTSQLYNIAGILKAKLKTLLRTDKISLASIQPCRETIYAPQGSFMIFSKEYFRRGGGFEHGVFLYGEEVTVAERCRRLGLSVVHDSALKVIHTERGSTGLLYPKRILQWKRESNNYLYDEYFKS